MTRQDRITQQPGDTPQAYLPCYNCGEVHTVYLEDEDKRYTCSCGREYLIRLSATWTCAYVRDLEETWYLEDV